MKARAITPEEVAEIKRVISYDAESGNFYHRVDRGRSLRYKAGTLIEKVPNKTHGYITFEINKRSYLAHRVAWLLVTGEWPENIDHIDHNITNNRFSNLRSVSHEENMKNTSLNKRSQTGVLGIALGGRKKDKWRVTVSHSGRQHYLGEYSSFEEAVAVRKNAMMQHGYHANHGLPSMEQSHV